MIALAMDTLPPSPPSAVVPNASDDLELTDDLHKALIEVKFF